MRDAPTLRDPVSIDDDPLVLIQPGGPGLPLFCVHPAGGGVSVFRELAPHLGLDQVVYACRGVGLYGERPALESLAEMARHYIERIRRVHPSGPFALCGWSIGSLIAFEMASQLEESGQVVTCVVMIDPPFDWLFHLRHAPDEVRERTVWLAYLRIVLRPFPEALEDDTHELWGLDTGGKLAWLTRHIGRSPVFVGRGGLAPVRGHFMFYEALIEAGRRYNPARLSQAAVVVLAAPDRPVWEAATAWRAALASASRVVIVPGVQLSTRPRPRYEAVAAELRAAIASGPA